MTIDLSLLDNDESVALGNIEKYNCQGRTGSGCSILGTNDYFFPFFEINSLHNIFIAPYFSIQTINDSRIILPPKSTYITISVKMSREDLPRVKSAKLEVKPAGGD